ncbi:MAG TPA: type II toxin-antitoxin system PemK/MazF family toxin [Gemmatimonadaceae bacterium]|jgi:mRNA interferase MazF|nr:type II toxin-antitoxin system PemK/MazF family toxin [Gemmatimonadaceae bacterium]
MNTPARPASVRPSRGEIWQVNLSPSVGRETNKVRPALILSVNALNHGPAELVIVVPISTVDKGIATHVRVRSGEGGQTEDAFIKCEEVKSISTERLVRKRGTAHPATLAKAIDTVKILLGIP